LKKKKKKKKKKPPKKKKKKKKKKKEQQQHNQITNCRKELKTPTRRIFHRKNHRKSSSGT